MHRFVPPALCVHSSIVLPLKLVCLSAWPLSAVCRDLSMTPAESVVVVSVRVLGDMICLLYARRRKTGGLVVV